MGHFLICKHACKHVLPRLRVRNKYAWGLLWSVTAIEHWVIRCWVSTSGHHWGTQVCVCVCVWLVHWGWVCCFNPEVFSCKTIPVGCYLKALQIVSETLSDNDTERIHPFEGSFASSRDQGRPLIVFAFFFFAFILLFCPLCCHR